MEIMSNLKLKTQNSKLNFEFTVLSFKFPKLTCC